MVEAQRNRRLWLETAIIFAAWAVFGLLVANQSSMLSALGGRPMPWVIALRPALLEAALWAFTTLAIALARSGVMVVLGWYVPWVRTRTFSPQFWGTSSQNFLFYALLLGIAHLVIYSRRYREREQAKNADKRTALTPEFSGVTIEQQSRDAIRDHVLREAHPARCCTRSSARPSAIRTSESARVGVSF